MAKPKTPKKNVSSVPQSKPKGDAPIIAPVNNLPLPQVLHSTANSTLPPMSSTAGTAVIITAAAASGAQINVFWAIKGQEANPVFTTKAQGNGSAGVEVPIPAWVVGYCIAKTLTIWYQVGNDSSLRLELTVEVIDPNDMLKPVFTDLVFFQGSWWLDMAKFPGNAGVELCAWPFIAAGQRLWVEAVGNEHLSPRRFYWILENHVVAEEEAQQGFCFLLEILREWLAENQDWSSVTVHAGVTYDGAHGTPPEDPAISHIPANAHEIPRATANLRLGEPELNLLPPKLREAVYVEGQGYVLNPALTVDGGHIEVTYDRMKPGDHVCVRFEGTPGQGSPVLVCQDVQDGETKLVFPVPASAFSANFGRAVVLSYTVLRDHLWPSQKLTVQVLELVGLSGIDVEEKTDGKLCLNNFSGPANATVAQWDYIAPGQICWMWIVGKSEDGTAIYRDILVAEPLKPEWVTDGVSTELARAELEKLADCEVFDIHFAVNFQGLADKAEAIAFRPLQLQMIQAELVLLAPSVREAIGNHLTVWNGRNGVTVRVEYDRMSPHHTITLCWEQAGVCLALGSKPGNITPGYVDFLIPREAVIHGIGKTVPIRFSVSSRCKQQTSPDLELEISVPVRLPTPAVTEATPYATQGGILDLRTFVGDARITVEKWWFMLLGQIGWLKCIGTADASGSPHTINVAIAEPITASDLSDGLEKLLPRAELEKLRNETSLVIEYKVTPDVGGVLTRAIAFPALNLQFRKPFYHHTDFDPAGKGWNGWQKGPGAVDSRDLRLKTGAVPGAPSGTYVEDWGYTNTQDPVTQRVKLYQDFNQLEIGRIYKFSAWIRDSYAPGTGRKALLVLVAQGVDISPITAPGRPWELIQGTFLVTSSTTRLSLDNLQMGRDPINDFDTTQITVEEI
ncbi:hypothetical protein [Pseudomonas sp. Marseille-Q1929]|uniref:hypothetical protein n=1 Tax=Pseudomonas sp. Marseille-Q1929 TaxID=2730402 RepID=UPI001A8C548E|nr:hypothetical protein [Pseudomonas sp. Marseille-Q1929]MBO0496369.1 hypothetical protein [Pseudomonas sp. Marseille-Q1929]